MSRSVTNYRRILFATVLSLLVFSCLGCVTIDNPAGLRRIAELASFGTEETVVLREVKPGPIRQAFQMMKAIKPIATDRSLQTLRRYALIDDYKNDRPAAIDKLWSYAKQETSGEIAAAVAQLSVAEGQFHKDRGDLDRAAPWFLLAMASSNDFLWDSKYKASQNIYDPLFREVSDIYNQCLKAILSHLKENKSLDCNSVVKMKSRGFECELTIQSEVGWKREDFEKFEFASDYQINGLANKHYQYGLGVPLIAVLKTQPEIKSPEQEFYPPGLTIPLTAFMKVDSSQAANNSSNKKLIKASVHLVDPLKKKHVWIAGKKIPLEIDISTPLAYYLNDPLYRSNLLATAFLIDADLGKKARGLYMLEPYDPNKIPVVMVHGFWSSALTWTEMFNDLRAQKELQKKYQFWFYMYPTGQPFWASAQQMREDLAELRGKLDPKHQAASLDEMVLVGHSMGGLISLLQTVDSKDHFWNVVSDRNIDQIKGDPETLRQLRETFYFKPNPSIKRVVTLGTPHRGSDFANSTTRWLGHKLLSLPKVVQAQSKDLEKNNPGAFDTSKLMSISTSIDSLAPDSPFFGALAKATPSKWTQYHNVIGNKTSKTWSDSVHGFLFGESEGDGVVRIENAQLPYAESEDQVDASHMEIHRKPKSIWIVRQVLLQHLNQTEHLAGRKPKTFQSDTPASYASPARRPRTMAACLQNDMADWNTKHQNRLPLHLSSSTSANNPINPIPKSPSRTVGFLKNAELPVPKRIEAQNPNKKLQKPFTQFVPLSPNPKPAQKVPDNSTFKPLKRR